MKALRGYTSPVATDRDELLRILNAGDFPWANLFNRGERAVPVVECLEYANDHGADVTERELDGLIESLGGQRIGLVDPWSWPVRVFKRRFLGETLPTNDMYSVPDESLKR